MSAISLRLPNSLHAKLRELAEQEGVSINQFITVALAEKISAMITEEYLGERSRRGNKQRFERALSKVGEAEPAEEDKL